MQKRNSEILISQTFIIGTLLLILNDFVFKNAFSNPLTGKLSDFAGLFIFPMFLTYLLPNTKKTNYILTCIGFILWKLPIADYFIDTWNHYSFFSINRVLDYTDYIALISLPVSYLHVPKPIKLPKKTLAINGIGIIAFIAFCSTAGTHGSIKGYEYPTSKEALETAIIEVINENPSISRPESKDDYYNTGGYITISIKAPEEYKYTFRFYGGEEHWKNSPNKSEIFICYAHDNEGNGGSEGGGGVEWYKWGVKSKLTEYFEKNFISKLDSKLGLEHIDKE
ncbi:MAG: hypothetical protein KFKLKKLM_01997 [Flavobacteriales bacterium]|nr:hypothetical protein [Flavobacteriales bacterium]